MLERTWISKNCTTHYPGLDQIADEEAAAHFELYITEHQSSHARSSARDGEQHPSAVRAGGGNPVLNILRQNRQ
jgi:hypothetical protein